MKKKLTRKELNALFDIPIAKRMGKCPGCHRSVERGQSHGEDCPMWLDFWASASVSYLQSRVVAAARSWWRGPRELPKSRLTATKQRRLEKAIERLVKAEKIQGPRTSDSKERPRNR